MGVVMAGCAGFRRRPLGVRRMGLVAGAAIQGRMGGVRTHRQARLGDGHAHGPRRIREPIRRGLRQQAVQAESAQPLVRVAGRRDQGMPAHAVPAFGKGLRLLLVAVSAGGGVRRGNPLRLDRSASGAFRQIRRMARGAVYARRRMAGAGPLPQRLRVLQRRRRRQGGALGQRLPALLGGAGACGKPMHRRWRNPGPAGVAHQKAFVQRLVVVVVVAAGRCAAVEGEARMAGPRLAHVLIALGMAGCAEVRRRGDRARARDLRAVLEVAGRAKAHLEPFQIDGHSGAAEQFARVAVVGGPQPFVVAIAAGLVQRLCRRECTGEGRGGVAGLAGQLDLMVGVGGVADQEHPAVAANDHPGCGERRGGQGSRNPKSPGKQLPRHRPLQYRYTMRTWMISSAGRG